MGEARAERLGPHPFANCAGYAQRCPARPGSAHETRAGLVATAGAVRTRWSFSAPTRASGSMKKPPRRLQQPSEHSPWLAASLQGVKGPAAPSHMPHVFCATIHTKPRFDSSRTHESPRWASHMPPTGIPSQLAPPQAGCAGEALPLFPGPIGMQHEWIIAACMLDWRYRRLYECLTQLLTDGFPNAS